MSCWCMIPCYRTRVLHRLRDASVRLEAGPSCRFMNATAMSTRTLCIGVLLLVVVQHGALGRQRLLHDDHHLPHSPTVVRRTCEAYAHGFLPIKQTVEVLKQRGGLTREDMAQAVTDCGDGCAHILIYKQQLYIGKANKGFETRLEAAILLLAQAVTALHGHIPDVEFVVSVHDAPAGSPGSWNIIRRKDTRGVFVMPAYPQYMWLEASAPPWPHTLARLNASESNRTWAEKPASAYFQGAGHPNRREYRAQIPDGPDLAISMFHDYNFTFKPPEAACDYRFVLLWDGAITSLRASTLALCRSVIIHHDSPWEDWVEGVLNAYSGWGGIRSVGSNWTALRTIMAEANADPSAVDREVATRADMMQRLLSFHGINCYWLQLLRDMAGLLRYPVALEPAYPSEKLVPIEQWMLTHLQMNQR